MEEKPKLSTWQRSTTRRFLRWLSSPRTLRRGLIALAWIVSIIALYYGVTDWRDRRAWDEYRQNFEAHVAPLELPAYVPKDMPDSENFAAAPFANSWMNPNAGTNFLFEHDAWSQADHFLFEHDAWSQADHLMPFPAKSRHYAQNFQDLQAWQSAFAAARAPADPHKHKDEVPAGKLDLASRAQAAPAVLDGLKDDDAAFEELRAASARPQARYQVVYNMENPVGILLPHLAKIKGTCQRLELKACAELAAGQSDNALADVKLMLYLADTLKTEPFLISYMVRVACVRIAVVPIWEGLAEHRWNDAQLQELQGRLDSYNFLTDIQWSLHAERAMGVLMVDLIKKNGLFWAQNWGGISASPPNFLQKLLGEMIPSGWYDLEKLHYCQAFDGMFQGSADLAAKRAFPRQIAANAALAYNLTNGLLRAVYNHNLMAAFMLPALGRVLVKSAAAQTATDQAAIACALERYRLANGQFPENLQALAPRFINRLPNDVITGEPFKYRRTADGRFVLYSVGWNETDDGGVSGKTAFDEKEGDWVWEYPAAGGT
jgi:hypothetical protein